MTRESQAAPPAAEETIADAGPQARTRPGPAPDADALLAAATAFCEAHGIAASTFGRLAVNDGKFLGRIAAGSRIEPETARRVTEFMERAARGEIVLRGRPRRKKDESHALTMAELISQETSVRTPGSFAFHEQRQRYHVFANTTNESWVLADRVAGDLAQLAPGPDGLRLFFAPMDNGIALTRILRAVHAAFPDTPILVVLKGRGLEDLRNTMGRMVDRMTEHPLTVFALTNLYTREALLLRKLSEDNPAPVAWREVGLEGSRSYDFQVQVAELYGALAREWLVRPGAHGQPVYARPSVLTVFRADQRARLERLLPRPGGAPVAYDYALLNHPYLHSHTMKFRMEHVLGPVARALVPGGQMTVVQSHGEDPAHEIVRRLWPEQPLHVSSRYDIIQELRRDLAGEAARFSFSGLTDARSLFRFDMHTLPVFEDGNLGPQSLAAAWNNAVYYAQVREDLAEAALREGSRYLSVTRDVLRAHGGLWFVNESFSVQRVPD